MPTPVNDDPTIQLWRKVRRPLLGVVFLFLALSQVPRLLSGELFPTVTGGLLIAFIAWFVWRPLLPQGDKTTTEYWRRNNRSAAAWWAFWLAIAAGWLAWGSWLYGFNPRGLIVLVLPTVSLLVHLFGYIKAERIAELQSRNQPPTS